MVKEISKTNNRNKGFTLVELIVVLVILAILAAILIPALLGYIDRAKTNNDILDAHYCVEAVQSELVELYAFEMAGEEGEEGGSGNDQKKASVFPGYVGRNGNGDVEMSETVYNRKKASDPNLKNYAEKIFKIADDHPYIFIVGLGSREEYKGDALRATYIVYVAMYQKTKDSKPIFFDGERWVTDYLGKNTRKDDKYKVFDGSNTMISKNTKLHGMKIQYYMLADGDGKYSVTTSNSVWEYLRKQAAKNN